MTRVLKRPMFRLGGPANEGITSGLAPRRGYATDQAGGLVDPRDLKVSDLDKLTIGQMQDVSRSPRGGDLSKFLIDFGLDIASATPSGSILSTAAESAKAPYERFQGRKAARAETEADMFSTLFKGATEAHGAEKAGKGWLEQWKFQQIPELNEKINRLSKLEGAGTISETDQLELDTARDQKSRIVSISPVLEGYLKNNKYIVQDEMDRLFLEDQKLPEEQRKYETKKDLQLEIDAIERVERRYMAKGGRVGYQAAGSVMGDAIQADQTMPEELGDISYEELRSRLPQEVGDEIVRLLANSAEALEDFATIQTEQDIANFNKKYGVNLVLPAEG